VTTGSTPFNNTAIGCHALHQLALGSDNVAVGTSALGNGSGLGFQLNTAVGSQALALATTGSGNTAIGFGSLGQVTTGSINTAIGYDALYANLTGESNIAVGQFAGINCKLSNNILIGNRGNIRDSGAIRIGVQGTQIHTFIAGISGQTVAGGVEVIVDANGQLGTITSSARYKEAIKPMAKSSEAILLLKPVTFRYKHELDPNGIPQFGLVAEQVEKVNPDLVARDEQGKAYTVRYEAVNAMLLNEFLKEHRKVEEQQAAIAQLKFTAAKQKDLQSTVAHQQKEIEGLMASLKEQAAQIQKVSDQLRTQTLAPRVVAND
jgi:hypothetical protein